jgi:hypothetical protein
VVIDGTAVPVVSGVIASHWGDEVEQLIIEVSSAIAR